MKCFVCSTDKEMVPYFLKNWGGTQPDHQFVKCEECGLVVDQAIYEMTYDEWFRLNNDAHKDYQGTYEVPERDPDWIRRLRAQADVDRRFCENWIATG